MGRIVANVSVKNLFEQDQIINFNALIDTGAAYMVLPQAWKNRLGKLNLIRQIDCETATQEIVKGEVCGPVEIKIEGFDPIYGEILFLAMIIVSAIIYRKASLPKLIAMQGGALAETMIMALLALIIVWATAGVVWMERSLRSVIQVFSGRNDDHGRNIASALKTLFMGTLTRRIL